MESWDLRIVSATYKSTPDENIVVEIYGHTRDGRSIVALDLIKDQMEKRPYCFIVSEDPDLDEFLRARREVLDVRRVTLFHRGADRSCVRVTVRLPKHVKQLREDTRIRGEFLAADIPFYLRYIYNNDLGSCIKVFGRKVEKGNYTADLVVEVGRTETVEAFNPPLRVLSFDIENSLKDINDGKVMIGEIDSETEEAPDEFYNKRILTICCVLQVGKEIVERASFRGSERKMLEEFTEYIRSRDPDIISGYNIEGYDLRVIEKRATQLGVPLRWGRDGSSLNGRRDQKYNKPVWEVTGRLIVDAWWAVKMDLRPKQETLNAVSMQLLGGETKLDVDPRKMDEEWEKNSDRVVEYCTRDAELSLRILNKLERVRKIMDLATVSKLPLEDVMKNRSSLLIDSILIRQADRSGVGVPMTKSFRDDEEAIEGGYVHEIEPGLYHWVCVLDFKSMYPSIIIAKNICFTTLSPDGKIVSPNGVHFLDKAQREGLLPNILVRLMKERDDTKRRMKEAKDKDEEQYYDGLQQAIKILMNSFYGVFASSFYRFTDKNIGSSITAFARETTKGIIQNLEREGYKVIYSDTDSVFVKSPDEDLEGAKAFGMRMAERFSKEGGMLEFEKIMESMFSHGKKKRYVGRTVWPKKELVVRGYEMRRTDSFDLQAETLQAVFDRILDGDIDGAMKVARSSVQEVLQGKVDPRKLVISKGCKAFSSYANPDSQATVQAAKKLISMGYQFVPGMKVSWIVTNSRRTPQEVTPWVEGRPFEGTPDWRYYAERVAQTVSRVTEVWGLDDRSLMSGNTQSNFLNGNFGPQEDKVPTNRKTEVKKTNKRLSLDDFM
ncbi:MAG: DNA polymerase II [Methanomassiliicoccales archaeon]|nr:MAG: DNA polymerase II [Methanomassiliicoccales archaeon]